MKNTKNVMRGCAALLLTLAAGTLLAQTAVNTSGKAMSAQEWEKTLASMPKGNAVRGAKVHAAGFCAGCHGASGLATSENWPHVAGQPAAVTIKALLDYREGRRTGDTMAAMMTAAAKKLSDREIADVAAYYASIAGSQKPVAKLPGEAGAIAEKLVRKGDASRTITPCAACHGYDAKGNPNGEVPVLHGQNALYLEASLKQYRTSHRTSDILSEMRFFSKDLTDEEIRDLSLYYAALPAAPAKDTKGEAKK